MATMTANTLIDRAAKRAQIVAGEEAMTGAEGFDALTELNLMLSAFPTRGIQYSHVDLAATDTVNVPDRLLDAVIWMFVSVLASEYGAVVSPDSQMKIADAEHHLQAFYLSIPRAKTSRGLLPNQFGWYSDITRGQ